MIRDATLNPREGAGQSDASPPFAAAFEGAPVAMVVTDPRTPDNLVLFANDAFLALTGYAREELIGRSGLLHGTGTDPAALAGAREAIAAGRDHVAELLHYRKDGTSFWGRLLLRSLAVADGAPTQSLGTLVDLTAERARGERIAALERSLEVQRLLTREIDHRVKNNLQMISAMLTLKALNSLDPEVSQTLQRMLERIDAIGLVHKRLYELSQPTLFDVADFIRELSAAVIEASGRTDIAMDLRLEPVVIAANDAAPLALILNEGLTNALKHGFRDGRPGRITVTLLAADGQGRIAIADDGAGLPEHDAEGSTFGTTLVATLAAQLDATVAWERAAPGTVLHLAFPLVADGRPAEG